MSDRQVRLRLEGRERGALWLKMVDNGDGTYSAAVYDTSAHSRLDDIEAKLDTLIARQESANTKQDACNASLVSIDNSLSGVLSVSIT